MAAHTKHTIYGDHKNILISHTRILDYDESRVYRLLDKKRDFHGVNAHRIISNGSNEDCKTSSLLNFEISYIVRIIAGEKRHNTKDDPFRMFEK